MGIFSRGYTQDNVYHSQRQRVHSEHGHGRACFGMSVGPNTEKDSVSLCVGVHEDVPQCVHAVTVCPSLPGCRCL